MTDILSGALCDMPDEIIFNILNRLDVDDIGKFLLTGSNIRKKYIPYFIDKIDEYLYPSFSSKKFVEKIEKDYQKVYGVKVDHNHKYYLLDKNLTRFMNLSYLPNIDGCAIVDLIYILKWWVLYLLDNDLINVTFGAEGFAFGLVSFDNPMIEIFGPAQNISYDTFKLMLGGFLNHTKKVDITEKNIYILEMENSELDDHMLTFVMYHLK